MPAAVRLIRRHPNVFVARTFSKAEGMALQNIL